MNKERLFFIFRNIGVPILIWYTVSIALIALSSVFRRHFLSEESLIDQITAYVMPIPFLVLIRCLGVRFETRNISRIWSKRFYKSYSILLCLYLTSVALFLLVSLVACVF